MPEAADLAYVAALIDQFGKLRTRTVSDTELPEVLIQGRIGALGWLAELTGTRVVEIRKAYARHQCSEHCPERHTDIASVTGRWVVTGARATVVLYNVGPFMRDEGKRHLASTLVWQGQTVGYKSDVVNDMARLGWRIPELRDQPRARIALVRP